MNLKEKARNLPKTPGVYFMKDSLGNIIYVGKSKNLKSRVSSYFQNSKSHSPKIIRLVNNIKDLDYTETDTELEALLLECTMIRKFKPTYNKLMKNPKSYCHIKVKTSDDYPYIRVSLSQFKERKEKGSVYFGPFTNKRRVKKAIKGVKEYFKILCNHSRQTGSYCLNYSLGFCMGICIKQLSKEESNSIFMKIIDLFNGIDKSVINALEDKMNLCSKRLDFEEAIKYRDYLIAINHIISKNKIIEFTKENKLIIAYEYLDDEEFKFFIIKGNKILFSEKYEIKSDLNNFKNLIKEKIISLFNDYKDEDIEITSETIDKSQIIYSYLKNNVGIKYMKIIDKSIINNQELLNIELEKFFSYFKNHL